MASKTAEKKRVIRPGFFCQCPICGKTIAHETQHVTAIILRNHTKKNHSAEAV